MTGRRYVVLAFAAGTLPVVVLAVFFVLPVIGMLELGFFPDGRLELRGAVDTLLRRRVVGAVWFTVWSSAVATAVTLLLGVPTAHLLYRVRFPGRLLLRGLVTAPFVLPTVVVGVAFRTLLAPSGPLGALGVDGTPVAIVAALVFFNVSVVVRTVGPSWEGMDRRREEAAAALGASPLQVLRTVTLPALRPAITAAATVVFLFCATAFGVVLTLGGVRYTTVETEIYLLTTQLLDLRAAAALSIVQVVVVVALLTVAGRHRAAKQGTEGMRHTPGRGLRRGDLPAAAATLLVVVLVTAPVAALVLRSLQVDGQWSLGNYRRLDGTGSGALLVPATTALSNSLRVAADATALALALGLVVSVLVSRTVRAPGLRRLLGVFDGVFMLPLGVSAVTVGFGFLVTLDRPPVDFRDDAWVVPVAQAMVALPLVVRTVAPALQGIDPRQREAAAALGASPFRVLTSVELLLVWRPLVAAAGFAFAVSLGEFGATSFLARPDRPTLPVVVFELISRPGGQSFGMALAASVLLAGLTAAVMVAVEQLRVRSVGAF